jgi:phosphoenolpyruvate synthase/pyruvate phosphate dikinase
MWLSMASDSPWATLAEALQAGLPVPDGFVVCRHTSESDIRDTYEELKTRTKIHFVAVRGPDHAVLNIIGADPIIHTLRRLWSESPDASILIQRMVPSLWCGKAQRHGKKLQIEANEGLMILDPDTYFFDTEKGQCVQKTIEPAQRKILRYVDGTLRTVRREGERILLAEGQLQTVVTLALSAERHVSWSLDDQDKAWLISRELH